MEEYNNLLVVYTRCVIRDVGYAMCDSWCRSERSGNPALLGIPDTGYRFSR